MMKMDDRNSAECQNWEKKDIDVILELFKLEKDKRAIVIVFFKLDQRPKRGGGENRMQWLWSF